MFQKHRLIPSLAESGGAPLTGGGEPAPRFALPAPLRYTIFGILLFLLIGAQGGSAERTSAVAAVVVLILCLFGPMPRWSMRNRFSLPALAVLLYFLVNSAAGLYARFGNFAAVEYGKILAAFCVFVIVVLRARRDEAPQLAAMAAAVSAAYGLLSIDASAACLLRNPFISLMSWMFNCNYARLNTGYETGTRITGIFSNPNFLAGFLALGIFLSLYLVRVSRSRPKRLAACIILGINTLSFLLAFSMGAIGTFIAAVFLCLWAERRGRRASLFVLLVETAAVTLIMAFLAIPGLGKSTGAAALLPDLAALLGGVLLWVIHEFGGLRLSGWLSGHGRHAAAAAGGLAAVLAVFLILAFNVTGGYTLKAGETLRRSVYPDAGTYTMEGTWTGSVSVVVQSQNRQDTIMHTNTLLYSGPLDGASFTVPEDSIVVHLSFRTAEGAQLDQAALSGGPKVKLDYKLLPGFAANRIQGLWANQNAIQRLAFFQDGMRIYAQSPVIGSGLGAVDGMLFSVQDFFYETKYVHNQYIQALADMGIPGLVTFVFLLGSAAAALIRRRREGDENHLLPALAGCLATAALHAITEIDWSMGPYQVLVLLTFGMIAAYFGRPLPKTGNRIFGIAGRIAAGGLCALFAVLLGCNLYAEQAYADFYAGRREQTAYSMSQLARLDPYNWAQYELDMAVNAAQSPREEFSTMAAQFAEHCRTLRIYTVNRSLERYVYLPMGRYEEFFQASREGIPQAASKAETWQEEFQLYETLFAQLSDFQYTDIQWYTEQILETVRMLEDYNEGRMEQIVLTDGNRQFLTRIQALADSGLVGSEARDYWYNDTLALLQ